MRIATIAIFLLLAAPALGAESAGAEVGESLAERKARALAERFPGADRDGDGRLSAEERSALRRPGAPGQHSAATSPTRAAATSLPEPLVIAYGEHPMQRLDLYQAEPLGTEPNPLLLYLHGGALTTGTRTQLDPLLLRLCLAAGISVASADYRLTPAYPLAAPREDALRALRFLRIGAPRWGLDPQRIAVGGDEAGALLALELGLTPEQAEPGADSALRRVSSRPAAVLAFDPPDAALGAAHPSPKEVAPPPLLLVYADAATSRPLDRRLEAEGIAPQVAAPGSMHPGGPQAEALRFLLNQLRYGVTQE